MKSLDSLLLSDIATRRVLGVTRDCPVGAAARRMGETRVSCLVVMDATTPCGIITERDLVRLLHRRPVPGALISDVVRSPVVTAAMDLDFRSAYALLRRHGIRHLVAVDGVGALAGLASVTDFRLHLTLDGFRKIDDLTTFLDPVASYLAPESTLAEALERMVCEPCAYVVVVNHGKALGILTERDVPLLLAAGVEPADVQIHEVMSTPVHGVSLGATAAEASARMAKLRIRHIAVVGSGQQLIGMVSQDALMDRIAIQIYDQDAPPVVRIPGVAEPVGLPPSHVLETTAVFAWVYDAWNDRLHCSPHMATLLGYPDRWRPAGFAGWVELIHPDDRGKLPKHLQVARATTDDRLHETECRLLKRNDAELLVRIRSRATCRDQAGCALEVVAMIAVAVT